VPVRDPFRVWQVLRTLSLAAISMASFHAAHKAIRNETPCAVPNILDFMQTQTVVHSGQLLSCLRRVMENLAVSHVERTVRRGIRSLGHRTVANSLHTHGDDPIFREVKGTLCTPSASLRGAPVMVSFSSITKSSMPGLSVFSILDGWSHR
jgi:hypothetical protein